MLSLLVRFIIESVIISMEANERNMPLLIVKMPKNWRKVNVSRFISRNQLKKIDTSLVLDVSQDQVERVSKILTRNHCEVIIAHLEPKEHRIVERLLQLTRQIREGRSEPSEMKTFTDKVLKEQSKISDDVMNLIHLATEFEEEPSILTLNQLEHEAQELLNHL